MNSRISKNSVTAVLNSHLIDYPTPINFNYWWGFGSLSGICLAIQLVTGIFLAMHYVPNIDHAFFSVEHIMRDVNYGWLLRYGHANGASMFFICVYLHMCRSLYYGSYARPRQWAWVSGVVIFVLMMGTAFMGYVLPWGQMSFWAATVITNLASAIPLVGPSIVEWVWGGFSVDNATLNRFFSFHYLLPFALTGGVGLHLVLVHQYGSNNPLGIDSKPDKIPFYPYFYVKDLIGLDVFLLGFAFFVFFEPNVLGHPDNYIPANPVSTPAHIVPEWYFLPFYAILRAIPDKLGGVICMGGALVALGLLPFLNSSEVRSSLFRPIYRILYWAFIIDAVILGWIGQKIVESPFQEIGVIATLFYFSFFGLVFFLSNIEIFIKKNN
jgi:ubiquinol-cytochrome c reductase cytochrome b subunit